MKTYTDVRVDDTKHSDISLSKLVGLAVIDVEGRISTEFGEPMFVMSKVKLSDGTTLWAEGEHDMPYLTNGTARFDSAQLAALNDEING